MTCAVVLCRTLAQTTLFVVFTGIVSTVIQREARPYINSVTNGFAYLLCWQCLLFILYCLLLDARMTSGDEAVALSATLMIANIIFIMVIFVPINKGEAIDTDDLRRAFGFHAHHGHHTGDHHGGATRRNSGSLAFGGVEMRFNPMWAAAGSHSQSQSHSVDDRGEAAAEEGRAQPGSVTGASHPGSDGVDSSVEYDGIYSHVEQASPGFGPATVTQNPLLLSLAVKAPATAPAKATATPKASAGAGGGGGLSAGADPRGVAAAGSSVVISAEVVGVSDEGAPTRVPERSSPVLSRAAKRRSSFGSRDTLTDQGSLDFSMVVAPARRERRTSFGDLGFLL